jgi:hypothetical protein
MQDDTKLMEMGTHQFTRGRPGKPMDRRQPKPSREHPRAGELARRQEAYDEQADRGRISTEARHRPGAIHSRGGRA